jgi:hypothetical protein
MNNGPEGKNTQEICIDEKGTRRIVPSSFLLSSRRERKKEVLIFGKLALLLLLLFFSSISSFPFLCTIYKRIDIMLVIDFLFSSIVYRISTYTERKKKR